MMGSSMVMLAAGGSPQGDINLSGGASTPNASFDFAIIPDNAIAGWRFNSDGSVQGYLLGTLVDFNPTPDEWFDPNGAPDATYYIRATNYTGDNPTSGTLGSVLALTSSRTWSWNRTTLGSYSGTLFVEIFSDAGGTNLLASGYYSGAATKESDL